ncbi:MAG: hypothetical protein IJG13_00715 [Kiritimatiellae bacterium]|nr:hypothetical protein [Kiritimatiellia bacterium]
MSRKLATGHDSSQPTAVLKSRRANELANIADDLASRNSRAAATFASADFLSERMPATTCAARSAAPFLVMSTRQSSHPIVRHMSSFVPEFGCTRRTAGIPLPRAMTWECISTPNTSRLALYTESARSGDQYSPVQTHDWRTSSGSLSITARFPSATSVLCSGQTSTFSPCRLTTSTIAALSTELSGSSVLALSAMPFSSGLPPQNSQRGVTRFPGMAQTNFPRSSPLSFMNFPAPTSSVQSK